MDGAAGGAGFRAVCRRVSQPHRDRRSRGGLGGRRAARRIPHPRRRHDWRNRVRPRRPRIRPHARHIGARDLRVGRQGPCRGAQRGPACRRAILGDAPRRLQRLAARAGLGAGRDRAGSRDPNPLMPLDFLLKKFHDLPATRSLIERLPSPGNRVGVGGLPGSSAAVLLATLARALAQRVFTIIAPTPADAERWLADLQTLLGTESSALYPQRESLGAEEPHYELAGERIETLEALMRGAVRLVIEVSKEERSLTETARRLDDMGYTRVPTVTEVAQYSVRGGILDVYGFGMATPARIEWWGDDVASVRSFDLDTQRSGAAVNRVTVLPVRAEVQGELQTGGQHATPLRTNLLDLLPTDTIVVTDQETAVEREVERAWADAAHHLEVARRMGEEPPRRDELLIDPASWRSRLTGLARLAVSDAETEQRFPIAPPEHVDRDLKRLRQIVAEPPATVILCDNDGQLERLEELIGSDRATLAVGALDGGFILPTMRVLTDHEIFRRARRLRRPRRYRSAVTTAASRPLTPGGYVVHLEHGIGIYRGLETIAVGSDGATLEV